MNNQKVIIPIIVGLSIVISFAVGILVGQYFLVPKEKLGKFEEKTSNEETLIGEGVKKEEVKTPEEKPTISIKYTKERPPSFKDFPVSEKFEGQPAPVDFSTNPRALELFTVITEGAKEGPNFAGHYTVIMWGCGTECQAGVIVDAKTGAIFSSSSDEFPLFGSSLGADFRIDSNLLIVDPPEVIQEVYKYWPVPDYIYTIYYKWENNQLVKIFDTKSSE